MWECLETEKQHPCGGGEWEPPVWADFPAEMWAVDTFMIARKLLEKCERNR